MYLIKFIIDILIVLFLLRLLISPNEAGFDPIYRIIFRITDPLLKPSKYVTRNLFQGIILSIVLLVILRGFVYMTIGKVSFLYVTSFLTGFGISLLYLIQLLFQFYMVVLIVSILSFRSLGMSFSRMIQRSFLPLNVTASWLRVPGRHFYPFSFISLLVVYAILSFVIYRMMILPQPGFLSFSPLHGLGEGLRLIFSLFPGFFTLVIIAGALLSWVSPDPYNPIVQAIYGISEPLLAPFRRFSPNLGGLDISPIFAILCFWVIGLIGQEIVNSLMKMG